VDYPFGPFRGLSCAFGRRALGHICAGTGLTPATSAPGPGPPFPHLQRDWACRSVLDGAAGTHWWSRWETMAAGSTALRGTDSVGVCSRFRMAVYRFMRHPRYQLFMYFVVLFDALRCA
jgi:hypothetical protein